MSAALFLAFTARRIIPLTTVLARYSLHSRTTVQRFTAGRAPVMSPTGSNEKDDALQDRAVEVGGAHLQTDAKNTTSNDVITLCMKKRFPR